jgi:hypothetical protein
MMNQEYLHYLFSYDEQVGHLVRNFRRGKAPKGTYSTCKDKDGYIVVSVDRKNYREHRLIWLYHYGQFPQNDIDHINWVRDDNRIENLRDVTKSQNKQNSPVQKNNKCGVKGVWLHKQTKKWCASIYVNGKNKYIGSYKSLEEAEVAYKAAKKILHDF